MHSSIPRSVTLAVLLILVPLGAVLAMSKAMTAWVGYDYVTRQLDEAANQDDAQALYFRAQGYSAEELLAHWQLLDERGRTIERDFLKADLLYPLFYGAVAAGALVLAWRRLGRPFSLPWLLAPVVALVIADWAENLAQLRQLAAFVAAPGAALDPSWTAIASAATSLKLLLGAVCALLGLWLALRVARDTADHERP